MVHAVCSGARVPSGEDRGQVRVMLPETVQHVASGHLLEGCLQVKSDQDSGLVRFGEVLDGFDHLVGSVLAADAVL